jgi:hypothetical protein
LSYLRTHDTGEHVYTVVGQPEIDGRFGYAKDFAQLNYAARRTSLSDVLAHLRVHPEPRRHAIAVQAAPAREVLKNWDSENPMSFVPESVAPTLWVNNRAVVAPHSDIHDNIACVAAGERRFTLFPPEAIRHMYLGPLLGAPGGVPVSAVDMLQPDLNRYPTYAQALAVAQRATLTPGDAIFIPALWWHGVESLEVFNVLVNYWFGGTGRSALSPYDALSHALLAIAELPREKRLRWREYFDHLVFRVEGQPGEHLPAGVKDPITQPSDKQVREILQQLGSALNSGDSPGA